MTTEPEKLTREQLAAMPMEAIEAHQLAWRLYADEVQGYRRVVAGVRNAIVNFDNIDKRIKAVGLEGQVTITVPNARAQILGVQPDIERGVNDGD